MAGGIEEVLLSVNDFCNLRCNMCNIWQSTDSRSFDPVYLAQLPRTISKFTLTGGEPFLSKNLGEIIRSLRQGWPKARIVVVTNGYKAQHIEKIVSSFLDEMPFLGFRVSIDGSEPVHDMIRGRRGSHFAAMNTLALFRDMGCRDLGISFTISDHNTDQLQCVYEMAQAIGVQFVCSVVHNSALYYRTTQNNIEHGKIEVALGWLVKQEMKSNHPKRWARAYFANGAIDWLRTRKRPMPCGAGSNAVYVRHTGDVYACNILDDRLGSLQEDTLSVILARSREKTQGLSQCHACWTMCNVRSGTVNRSLISPLKWVFEKKVLSLLEN